MKRHLFILLSLFAQNCMEFHKNYKKKLMSNFNKSSYPYSENDRIVKIIDSIFVFEDSEIANQILEDYMNRNSEIISRSYHYRKEQRHLLGLAIVENNKKVIDLLIDLESEVTNKGIIEREKKYFIELITLKNISNFFKIFSKHLDEDTFQKVIFDKAINNDFNNIMKEMLEKYLNIDIIYPNNNTLIHIAVKHNKIELVKYLLNQKIDIFAQNNKHEAAIDVARNNGHKEIEQIILEKEFEFVFKNIEDITEKHNRGEFL